VIISQHRWFFFNPDEVLPTTFQKEAGLAKFQRILLKCSQQLSKRRPDLEFQRRFLTGGIFKRYARSDSLMQ
jgi:hypothetical protein